ncbi:Component of the cap-binding complex (CBC) [Cichlidogyrus casuarinus]|uniref:Component of the cap-binding complex (CBC) n=1 Tax=Cichlidogyrus casuarinus TaxID=1844966 RepID=A0ABD2Q6L1_9PLAT
MFVGECLREFKENLKDNQFDNVKFILRFLADSLNCCLIEPNSFLTLLENLAEIPADSYASSQARADWYAYIILYCLPHCGKILRSSATRRCRSHISVLIFKALQVLWLQVNDLKSSGWVDKISWKLHSTLPSLQQHGKPHSFNPISPPDYDAYVSYPIPRVVFRMFDYTDVLDVNELDEGDSPVLPGAHTIERFLVDDYVQIIIESCSYNRSICARTLLSLETRARVPIEYIIVEQVLGGMFQLPEPTVTHGQLLFFGALIIQLCNESSMTIPLVLAQATELLFERLNQMKPICIERFVNWFSYHLTNYQMQWTWRDWAYALKENRMSPRKRLIVETFARLVRFSYFENVQSRVPKQFHKMLPPQPKFLNRYGGIGSIRELFERCCNCFY